MDALGLSQRCGNGGKGIGVKCVYGEYLYLIKFEGVFYCTASRRRFFGDTLLQLSSFFWGGEGGVFVLLRESAHASKVAIPHSVRNMQMFVLRFFLDG